MNDNARNAHMPITDDFRVHQDQHQQILAKAEPDHTFDAKHLTDIGLFDMPNADQMIVLQTYEWGSSVLEIVTVCGFYTNDGNVSIAVNHTNGLATLDDADLMFPTKED